MQACFDIIKTKVNYGAEFDALARQNRIQDFLRKHKISDFNVDAELIKMKASKYEYKNKIEDLKYKQKHKRVLRELIEFFQQKEWKKIDVSQLEHLAIHWDIVKNLLNEHLNFRSTSIIIPKTDEELKKYFIWKYNINEKKTIKCSSYQ